MTPELSVIGWHIVEGVLIFDGLLVGLLWWVSRR